MIRNICGNIHSSRKAKKMIDNDLLFNKKECSIITSKEVYIGLGLGFRVRIQG